MTVEEEVLGAEGHQVIGAIAIDPRNPDVVYVGALGRLWGPNEQRGLYKTTDGGANGFGNDDFFHD